MQWKWHCEIFRCHMTCKNGTVAFWYIFPLLWIIIGFVRGYDETLLIGYIITWFNAMSLVGWVLFHCSHKIWFTYPLWNFGMIISKTIIKKWDNKMRQKTVIIKSLQSVRYYKVHQMLRSVTDCCYKVLEVLRSVAAVTKWHVTPETHFTNWSWLN